MRDITRKSLEQLQTVQLFSNVGTLSYVSSVKVVSSWEEAYQALMTDYWRELRHDQHNDLSKRLYEGNYDHLDHWNDLCDEITAVTDPYVAAGLDIVPQSKLHKRISDAVRWDLLFAHMEIDYSNIATCTFFQKLLKWYLQGRFPCGWQGKYPKGKMALF